MRACMQQSCGVAYKKPEEPIEFKALNNEGSIGFEKVPHNLWHFHTDIFPHLEESPHWVQVREGRPALGQLQGGDAKGPEIWS